MLTYINAYVYKCLRCLCWLLRVVLQITKKIFHKPLSAKVENPSKGFSLPFTGSPKES